MMTELNINEICPPHEVRDTEKYDRLVEAFADGWVGRPLLVENLGEGYGYQSWTGSHRIAAARAAGIETIPVVVVDTAKLADAGETQKPNCHPGATGYYGFLGDDDMCLSALLRAGCDEEAALMAAEIENNVGCE